MDLLRFAALPSEPPLLSRHVYNQFSIRYANRDGLREFLRRLGIPTEIYYPLPLHMQPAFSYLGYRVGQFPHAEAVSAEILSLPVFPELSEVQQRTVVNAIADFYRN